jgi:hypothetical protein
MIGFANGLNERLHAHFFSPFGMIWLRQNVQSSGRQPNESPRSVEACCRGGAMVNIAFGAWRWISRSVIAAGFVCALGCGDRSSDFPGQLSYDAGNILYEQTDKISHRFDLKNTLSSDLKITNLVKSCTCTDLSVDPMLLKPGQVAGVTMTVRIPRKLTDFRAFCTIETDNERHKSVVCDLRFTSLPGASAEPAAISVDKSDFDSAGLATKQLKIFTFASLEKNKFFALSTEGLDGVSVKSLGDVALEDLGNRVFSRKQDVYIAIDRRAYERNVGTSRHVALAVDGEARLTFPISFMRSQDVEVHPSEVNFGLVRAGDYCSRRVVLKIQREPQEEHLSAVSDSNLVDAQIESASGARGTYTVLLHLDLRRRAPIAAEGSRVLGGTVELRNSTDVITRIPWTAFLR